MIRFVIKRKIRDSQSGLDTEHFETIDCDVPVLEIALIGGGIGENGYDHRELVGAEVMPRLDADRALLREALAWIENSNEPAPSLCGDIRKRLEM